MYDPYLEVFWMVDAKRFKEPGSGIDMEFAKWYILGDSGYAYTTTGYDTVMDAVLAAVKNNGVALEDICVCEPGNTEKSWFVNMCNIVKGQHLFNFWVAEDMGYLKEVNPHVK